jgi:hypothetical protein
VAECLHQFPKLRRFSGVYRELVQRLESRGAGALDAERENDGHGPIDGFHLPRKLRDVSSWNLAGINAHTLSGLASAGADTIEGALVLPSPLIDWTYLARFLPRFTRVRRLNLQECHTDDVRSNLRTTDACIAALLRDMPALTALELGSVARTMSGVTFVGAAYDRVCAPGLRELVVARVRTLGDEGIATIVRVCPHLRALDIRGCLGVTTDGFAAAVLEAPCAGAASKQHHALRLRKLRRVVASFRGPPPPALNFVQYHPGLSGRDERVYMLGCPTGVE